MTRATAAPPMNESELQRAVIQLARDLGWGVTQSQAKAQRREAEQYRVPILPLEGLIFHPRYSLGSEPGWPDLTLIRRRDRRLIFAELKAEKGVVSPRQAEVLELLQAITGGNGQPYLRGGYPGPPRMEVYVWRPSQLAEIADILR